jgi:hypothetical protein
MWTLLLETTMMESPLELDQQYKCGHWTQILADGNMHMQFCFGDQQVEFLLELVQIYRKLVFIDPKIRSYHCA